MRYSLAHIAIGILCIGGMRAAHGQAGGPSAPAIQLPDVIVIGATPLLGTGVSADSVPAVSQVLTTQDIDRTNIPSLTGALAANLASVHLNDLSGNPFQPDLLFRGFAASPVEGEPQGLAVYVNGARFNTPFGDTVNWDLIPSNAIAQVDVEGGNPIFGLNALGGSVVVRMKNGFSYQGGELVGYAGSYGRIGGLFQYGLQSQNTSAYIAIDAIHDHGWRDTGESELGQLYGDIGWRGDKAELHVSVTADDNRLGNPGATPEDLLSIDRAANSTAPNNVHNNYVNLNIRGSYAVSDSTSIQAVAYVSNLSQRLINGDTVDVAQCSANPAQLCEDDGVTPITTPNGTIVPSSIAGPNGYSGLAREGIDSTGYGGSAQVTNEAMLFGHKNRLIAGFSVDDGVSSFNGSEYFGGLSSNLWFIPPAYLVSQADLSTAPVSLVSYNQYYGIFITDRYQLTDRLALTGSGRFNLADISLHDRIGTILNANHQYSHFNPGVGLTYQALPPLQLFVNFSEANRAPTPNELECSNPNIPCLLPNAFVSDPNLKQVVARTVEVGARGHFSDVAGGHLSWDADLFRTANNDDIIFASDINSSAGGFFTNAGETRRQGVEINLFWLGRGVRARLGYTYTDATYQSALALNSPNNPAANAEGVIFVVPGDHLPLVPAHRATLVVDYDVTERWTIGCSLIASSSEYLFADDSNQTKPLGGYFVVNLNSSYRLTDDIQVFGVIDNVTNRQYATYGTFVPVRLISADFVNTRAYSPAPPIEAFAGVRMTF
jgi:iron complex outermembrane receptor protein